MVGLTVCYGAYGSEIFRAGISSIHRGQMEAARSLGMTYFQAMRHIILPQAVRVILPPIGNEFVALLKDSSLVSVLAVSDLTRRGREYMARTFLSFDTWIMVALCYLVLTLFSSRAVEFIEIQEPLRALEASRRTHGHRRNHAGTAPRSFRSRTCARPFTTGASLRWMTSS